MLGKLIVFDGPEGGGKDSIVESLIELLQNDFPEKKFVIHREPGGTVVGEEIRKTLLNTRSIPDEAPLPKPELLMYFAARGQLVVKEIWPLLEDGWTILLKRWYYASLAYQGVGRGLSAQDVLWLKRFVMGDFEANLSILLDVDPVIGLKRKNKQDEITRFEQEDLCFHNLVRIAFLDLFGQKIEQGLSDEWKVVDASPPFNEVLTEVHSITKQYLVSV